MSLAVDRGGLARRRGRILLLDLGRLRRLALACRRRGVGRAARPGSFRRVDRTVVVSRRLGEEEVAVSLARRLLGLGGRALAAAGRARLNVRVHGLVGAAVKDAIRRVVGTDVSARPVRSRRVALERRLALAMGTSALGRWRVGIRGTHVFILSAGRVRVARLGRIVRRRRRALGHMPLGNARSRVGGRAHVALGGATGRRGHREGAHARREVVSILGIRRGR